MKRDGFAEPERDIPRSVREAVARELKGGADTTALISRLQQQGLSKAQASFVIDSVQAELFSGTGPTDSNAAPALGAIVGGAFAAAVSGGAWALFAYGLQKEMDYLAVGVGLATGYLVMLLARGHRGPPFQVIAALFAAAGVLFGKYLEVFLAMHRAVLEAQGAEAVESMVLFSPEVWATFQEVIVLWVQTFGVVWAGAAVVVAWNIPRVPKGVVLPEARETGQAHAARFTHVAPVEPVAHVTTPKMGMHQRSSKSIPEPGHEDEEE
jgi:hypothetical protein